ncbi:MAG TPA: hypothetical protein VGL53_28210 [Bryobacteraceae bacterium]|jgi:hypothetical protein
MSTTTDKKPRTEAQIAASRANGAKSNGPTTPEGKIVSCWNRMTHGFRSNAITLVSEDADAYDRHLDAYLARYTPVDKTEEDLVGLLASSMWQIMRNNSIEVALFEIEITGVNEEIKGEFEHMDQYGRLALAFKKSAGDNALELLRRYKVSSERAYHRALQAIEEIQKARKPSQPIDEPSDQPPGQPAAAGDTDAAAPSPTPPKELSTVRTQEVRTTPPPAPAPTARPANDAPQGQINASLQLDRH